MLLLDTTAASDLMRLQSPALARIEAWQPREVLLCAPVAAEIRFGLERLDADSRRRALLTGEYERLRATVAWADWDEASAGVFGREKARLQTEGTPLHDMDLAIASIALSRDARLATSHVRHFDRIAGLELEDWS